MLHLSTQAGTYVKEFVHGDFQRTRPSLRELLQREVDIVALDVEVGGKGKREGEEVVLILTTQPISLAYIYCSDGVVLTPEQAVKIVKKINP